MELAVLIGGRRAGKLGLSGRAPAFSYDPAYANYDGPPLSVRFPIAAGVGVGCLQGQWGPG